MEQLRHGRAGGRAGSRGRARAVQRREGADGRGRGLSSDVDEGPGRSGGRAAE